MLIFDFTRVQRSVGPVRGLSGSRQKVSRSQPRNGESHSVDQVFKLLKDNLKYVLRITICYRICYLRSLRSLNRSGIQITICYRTYYLCSLRSFNRSGIRIAICYRIFFVH
jgi:hypothetical protein